MDIRHLMYFSAVAKQGSFTKASEVLHVSQPTLSKMVRLLEEELGVTLFDRSNKQIKLTDAGMTIFRSAQQIIQSMDNMSAELNDLVNLKKGTLNVGLPPMIGGRFFPSIVERFHNKYPKIRLNLTEQGGKRIEADVDSGELDVGIVILPVEGEASFVLEPFTEDRLSVVIHPSHPLADRKEISLKELANEPFILFREDFTLHHLIKEACRKCGFDPAVVFESTQWDFMTEMVSSKFGITLLPERVCRSLDPVRFRTVQLVNPVIPWRISMIWSKDKYVSLAAREWIRFVREEKTRIESAGRIF